MTEQERQRTIDFIPRSQADAVIRQERWEERMEERAERWEERFDKHQREMEKLRVEVREFAKAAHEALEATRTLTRHGVEHERRIRHLEKSEKRTTRRIESMSDVMRFLSRLEARSAKRRDELENR